MKLKTLGQDLKIIKGDHDRMFDWLMQNLQRHDSYFRFRYHWFHELLSRKEPMKSYSMQVVEGQKLNDIRANAEDMVPETHVRFLKTL